MKIIGFGLSVVVCLAACGAKAPSLTASTPPAITFDAGALVGGTARVSAAIYSTTPDDVRLSWLHCDSVGTCSPIAGAMGRIYQIALTDEGQGLRFDETATLAGTMLVTSSQISAAIDTTPIQTQPGQITGMFNVGGQLNLIPGQFDRAARIGNYQWAMCTSPSSCTPVTSTMDFYMVQAADAGKTPRVRYEAEHLGTKAMVEVSSTTPIAP